MWSFTRNFSVLFALLPLMLSHARVALTLSPTFTPDLAEALLLRHNEYRRMEPAANMYKLHWNISLQQRADAWIQGCDFEHEHAIDVGENLFFDTDHANDVLLRGLKAWHDEKFQYSYTSGHCMASCHYTQVVWSFTTTIGCSARVCPSMKVRNRVHKDAMFLACYYYPRGNFLGMYPYTRGGRCTACAEGDSCEDQLCVSSGPESKTAPMVAKMLQPLTPVRHDNQVNLLKGFQFLVHDFVSHAKKTPQTYIHAPANGSGRQSSSRGGSGRSGGFEISQSVPDSSTIRSNNVIPQKGVDRIPTNVDRTVYNDLERSRHKQREEARQREHHLVRQLRRERERQQRERDERERQRVETMRRQREMEEEQRQRGERMFRERGMKEEQRKRDQQLAKQRKTEEVRQRMEEMVRQRKIVVEHRQRKEEVERQREMERKERQKEEELERQRKMEKKERQRQEELERQREMEKKERQKEEELERQREVEKKERQRQEEVERQREMERKERQKEEELERQREMEKKQREEEMTRQREAEKKQRKKELDRQKEIEERERAQRLKSWREHVEKDRHRQTYRYHHNEVEYKDILRQKETAKNTPKHWRISKKGRKEENTKPSVRIGVTASSAKSNSSHSPDINNDNMRQPQTTSTKGYSSRAPSNVKYVQPSQAQQVTRAQYNSTPVKLRSKQHQLPISRKGSSLRTYGAASIDEIRDRGKQLVEKKHKNEINYLDEIPVQQPFTIVKVLPRSEIDKLQKENLYKTKPFFFRNRPSGRKIFTDMHKAQRNVSISNSSSTENTSRNTTGEGTRGTSLKSETSVGVKRQEQQNVSSERSLLPTQQYNTSSNTTADNSTENEILTNRQSSKQSHLALNFKSRHSWKSRRGKPAATNRRPTKGGKKDLNKQLWNKKKSHRKWNGQRRERWEKFRHKSRAHRQKFVIDKDGRRCMDRHPQCPAWAAKCHKNTMVKRACPLTCGTCKGHVRRSSQSRDQLSSYHNKNLAHPRSYHGYRLRSLAPKRGYSRRGQVGRYQRQRLEEESGSFAKPRALSLRSGPDQGSRGHRRGRKPKSFNAGKNGLIQEANVTEEQACEDDPALVRSCRYWAERGFCASNSAVREISCRRSCDSCAL